MPQLRDCACEFRLGTESRDEAPQEPAEGCRVCAVALGWTRAVCDWARLPVDDVVARGAAGCGLFTLCQPPPLLLLQLPELSLLYTVPSWPA